MEYVHAARKFYRKELKKEWITNWKSVYENIEKVPEATRSLKILARDPATKLITIKLLNSRFSNNGEFTEVLPDQDLKSQFLSRLHSSIYNKDNS